MDLQKRYPSQSEAKNRITMSTWYDTSSFHRYKSLLPSSSFRYLIKVIKGAFAYVHAITLLFTERAQWLSLLNRYCIIFLHFYYKLLFTYFTFHLRHLCERFHTLRFLLCASGGYT